MGRDDDEKLIGEGEEGGVGGGHRAGEVGLGIVDYRRPGKECGMWSTRIVTQSPLSS